MHPALEVVIALAKERPDEWSYYDNGYYTFSHPNIRVRNGSRHSHVEFGGTSWHDTERVEMGPIASIRVWWAFRPVKRAIVAKQEREKLRKIREKLNGLPNYRYPVGDDS